MGVYRKGRTYELYRYSSIGAYSSGEACLLQEGVVCRVGVVRVFFSGRGWFSPDQVLISGVVCMRSSAGVEGVKYA